MYKTLWATLSFPKKHIDNCTLSLKFNFIEKFGSIIVFHLFTILMTLQDEKKNITNFFIFYYSHLNWNKVDLGYTINILTFA
jgi:hypothetical protein